MSLCSKPTCPPQFQWNLDARAYETDKTNTSQQKRKNEVNCCDEKHTIPVVVNVLLSRLRACHLTWVAWVMMHCHPGTTTHKVT